VATPVALVTGASAGLGRELARLFAADREALVLVARRRDRLDRLAGELRAAGAPAVHVVADDLADPAAPARIEQAVTEAGLEVDALVNNAGFGSNGAFVDLDRARELSMVQVNVTAVVDLTRRFLPGMVARGRGRVLNLGSTAGFQPGPYMATYYATKAFVNSFTEAIAYELRGTGVTATVSCPGPTATEFGEVAGNARSRLFALGAADAAGVAREAYRAMNAGKPRVIHGVSNAAASQLVRVGPRAAVVATVARLNRTRKA
jgi:short-subunit dehydrogenase